MLSRALPLLRPSSLRPLPLSLRRSLHKGVDSTPPLRYTSIEEKLALYTAICVTFLSYPTYVLINMKYLRPPAANVLRDDVQDEINAIRAARTKAK